MSSISGISSNSAYNNAIVQTSMSSLITSLNGTTIPVANTPANNAAATFAASSNALLDSLDVTASNQTNVLQKTLSTLESTSLAPLYTRDAITAKANGNGNSISSSVDSAIINSLA